MIGFAGYGIVYEKRSLGEFIIENAKVVSVKELEEECCKAELEFLARNGAKVNKVFFIDTEVVAVGDVVPIAYREGMPEKAELKTSVSHPGTLYALAILGIVFVVVGIARL